MGLVRLHRGANMRVVALFLTSVVCLLPIRVAGETAIYQYDPLGRLVSSTLTYGSATSSTAIGYDPADNRSSYQVGISGGSSPIRAAMTQQSAPVMTPWAGPRIIAPYLSKFKKPSGH